MKVKKITNLKYSPSENRKRILLSECLVRKNKMLSNSDWTQLNDVRLSERSRYLWAEWRNRIRQISIESIDNIVEYNKRLRNLEKERDRLPLEYITDIESENDVLEKKKQLFKMINDTYHKEMGCEISPNIGEILNEITLIIHKFIFDNNIICEEFLGLDSILEFIEENEFNINLNDYPFLKINSFHFGGDVKLTMMNVIQQKIEFNKKSLQMEKFILQYRLRINGSETMSELMGVENEIKFSKWI